MRGHGAFSVTDAGLPRANHRQFHRAAQRPAWPGERNRQRNKQILVLGSMGVTVPHKAREKPPGKGGTRAVDSSWQLQGGGGGKAAAAEKRPNLTTNACTRPRNAPCTSALCHEPGHHPQPPVAPARRQLSPSQWGTGMKCCLASHTGGTQ